MYFHDFKLNIDDKELNEKIFNLTMDFLEKEIKTFQEKLFISIIEDIEHYMYERFENVQEQYFREIVSFLLGNERYINPEKENKLKEWLRGLGYTQESFRRKIYEDNKDDIVEQIQYDAVYELIQNMFTKSYLKSWHFKDINNLYLQSEVIKGFLDALIEKDGFQKYLSEVLDEKNKAKYERLQELKNKLKNF